MTASWGAASLLTLVERHGDNPGRRGAAANVDLNVGARAAVIDGHIGHADRLAEERRLCSAGHDADGRAALDHAVSMPRDAPVDHFESDQPAGDAARLLLEKPLPPDDRFVRPADHPAEPRLEYGGGLVDAVAVQAHRRLEPSNSARP